MVRWFYILDRVLIRAGISPSTGSISEYDNRIKFGMRTKARIDLARQITREIGIPESAVIYIVANPELLPCRPKDPYR